MAAIFSIRRCIMSENKYTAAVITVSDKGAAGTREDVSGQVIVDTLVESGFSVLSKTIVPDEADEIKRALYSACGINANVVLTTGGTGFSKRDITPEATSAVIEREAQGIAEAIRYYSLQITPRAMLSRGVAGIRGESIIVNLPGSPKAVKEALGFILESLKHGIDILKGTAHDCARK